MAKEKNNRTVAIISRREGEGYVYYVGYTHEQAFIPESIAQELRVVGFSSIRI